MTFFWVYIYFRTFFYHDDQRLFFYRDVLYLCIILPAPASPSQNQSFLPHTEIWGPDSIGGKNPPQNPPESPIWKGDMYKTTDIYSRIKRLKKNTRAKALVILNSSFYRGIIVIPHSFTLIAYFAGDSQMSWTERRGDLAKWRRRRRPRTCIALIRWKSRDRTASRSHRREAIQ